MSFKYGVKTVFIRKLSDYAAGYGINVIVENHGGNSSIGKWLSEIMKTVNKPNCGTLPDLGNFYEYDRYQGVTDMMPFAKGVSGKPMILMQMEMRLLSIIIK